LKLRKGGNDVSGEEWVFDGLVSGKKTGEKGGETCERNESFMSGTRGEK